MLCARTPKKGVPPPLWGGEHHQQGAPPGSLKPPRGGKRDKTSQQGGGPTKIFPRGPIHQVPEGCPLSGKKGENSSPPRGKTKPKGGSKKKRKSGGAKKTGYRKKKGGKGGCLVPTPGSPSFCVKGKKKKPFRPGEKNVFGLGGRLKGEDPGGPVKPK